MELGLKCAERAEVVLRARPEVDTLQLRMKRPAHIEDTRWSQQLHDAIVRSQRAADAAGVTLVVNDHWHTALQAGARALHLGQEDLLALSADDQALLRGQGHRVQLGLSSHSLWELARALGCGPSLIACGPVQATTTKHMPWQPQGRHNLSWWVAHSPVPVVGIGGLLTAADLQHMSGAGAAALCVVRALGQDPTELPARLAALRTLRLQPHGAQGAQRAPALPHPVL